MAPVETVEQALRLAETRLEQAPEFGLYASCVAQLKYLRAVLTGDEKDRSRLKHIIIGHYAAREYEQADPQLADALFAAQAIASGLAMHTLSM